MWKKDFVTLCYENHILFLQNHTTRNFLTKPIDNLILSWIIWNPHLSHHVFQSYRKYRCCLCICQWQIGCKCWNLWQKRRQIYRLKMCRFQQCGSGCRKTSWTESLQSSCLLSRSCSWTRYGNDSYAEQENAQGLQPGSEQILLWTDWWVLIFTRKPSVWLEREISVQLLQKLRKVFGAKFVWWYFRKSKT